MVLSFRFVAILPFCQFLIRTQRCGGDREWAALRPAPVATMALPVGFEFDSSWLPNAPLAGMLADSFVRVIQLHRVNRQEIRTGCDDDASCQGKPRVKHTMRGDA